MTKLRVLLIALGFAALGLACGEDKTSATGDASADLDAVQFPDGSSLDGDAEPGVDTHAELAPDATEDTNSEGSPELDTEVTTDANTDANLDTEPEAEVTPDADETTDSDVAPEPEVEAPSEVTPETQIETTPDLPSEELTNPPDCAAGGDVAALRACPQGDFDPPFLLTDVVVTYLYDEGFFVQDDSGAIMVFTGPTPAVPLPELGQILELPVKKLSDYEGTAEVTKTGTATVTGTTDEMALALALDEGAGTSPSEAIESALVAASEVVVTGGEGLDLLVRYGSVTEVAFHVDDADTLCDGASFTLLRAVVIQQGEEHRIESFHLATDIAELDTSACVVPDTSNWGFELDDASDPPPGFEKATGFFTATQSTSESHSGAASCALTWKNNANQDMFQALWIPVSPGDPVRFDLWVLDGDDDGRARPGVTFYDSAKEAIVAEWAVQISVDAPGEWQDLFVEADAPANAAYVRGLVRMYDVGGGADGEATLYIDDWTLSNAP